MYLNRVGRGDLTKLLSSIKGKHVYLYFSMEESVLEAPTATPHILPVGDTHLPLSTNYSCKLSLDFHSCCINC